MSQASEKSPVRRPTALIILLLLQGFGGLAFLPALHRIMVNQELQVVRILGIGPEVRGLAGPFEALGVNALVVAGMLFVVLLSFNLLAAYWLWNARKDGAVLALILLFLTAIFWYGFALPAGPVVAIPELILIPVAWRNLR